MQVKNHARVTPSAWMQLLETIEDLLMDAAKTAIAHDEYVIAPA